MKYAQIRKAFVDYFKSHSHQPVDSSSLIPHNDPTLMFTNAGMNQFKDVFLGSDKRDYNRAVTIQKCLRAGGKHNDLENVGFTARHHTFFEMLGNFSFGDYFKEDAIKMAWEFLTKTLGIPEDRLYVSVFTTDDEAFEIWEKQIGVPKEKIFRFGEKDNFWRMGQTGPCGPCSEIFYDHNPDGPKIPIDQDEDRFVEIWNLVFMQFFEDESGKQTPLPKPSVDTGSGIERVAAAMQGVKDNYQSDVFQPLMEKTCSLAGIKNDWNELSKNPETLGSVKVVADHARSTAFLIAEGVLPGSDKASYVLRSIMRRAIRYARKLNDQKSIFPSVCEEVIKTMSEFYPELAKKSDFIIEAVKEEEKRFLQTLDKGTEILLENIEKLKSQNKTEVDGLTTHTLKDTYGFPPDLTEVIAKEHGMTVDMEGYFKQDEIVKDIARKAHKSQSVSSNEKHLAELTQSLNETKFLGYDQLQQASTLIALSNGENTVDELTNSGFAIFDQTPFYAEGGGQVGDVGYLFDSSGKKIIANIVDCKKMNDVFIHEVNLQDGNALKKDTEYNLQVIDTERQATANNHSATHLLNAALKNVLGEHVNQAGSLVNPKKLRFDFNHNKPVSFDELQNIESMVNEQIKQSTQVTSQVMSQDDAIAAGATAMFGEKYGDEVRVISMGSSTGNKVFSMELCGGTHVSSTSDILNLKIVTESGVAAGVRRIEALTGKRAEQYISELAQENKDLCKKLTKSDPTEAGSLNKAVFALQSEIKTLENQLKGKGGCNKNQEAPSLKLPQGIDLNEALALETLQVCESLNAKKPKVDDESFGGGLTGRVNDLINKKLNLENDLEKRSSQSVSVDDLMNEAIEKDFNGEKGLALFTHQEITDRNLLSEVADKLRDKNSAIAVTLIGEAEGGKPKPVIVAISKKLKSLHAGKIMKELCGLLDGKGGGRPDYAQGSVSDLTQLDAAKDKFYELLDS